MADIQIGYSDVNYVLSGVKIGTAPTGDIYPFKLEADTVTRTCYEIC